MSNSTAGARRLWYSTNNWATSAQVSATNVTTTGAFIGTVVVPSGTTIYLALGDSIDIIDGCAPVSGKVSTANDYNAAPSICGASVNTTEFVDFNFNINANTGGGFDLACSV
jgi:hypothetical protein